MFMHENVYFTVFYIFLISATILFHCKILISSNGQMLALKAIYGDSVVSLDKQGGLRLFQVLQNCTALYFNTGYEKKEFFFN